MGTLTRDDFGDCATTLDFDELTGGGNDCDGDEISIQYPGLVFDVPSGICVVCANAFLGGIIPNNSDPNVAYAQQNTNVCDVDADPAIVTFDPPVTMVGMDYFTSVNADFNIRAFNEQNTLIESLTVVGTPNGPVWSGFAGIAAPTATISQIEIFSRSSTFDVPFNFSFDDFIFQTGACVTPVAIDIKPGSCPNSFNRNSNGVLPVALVGTVGLNAADVDASSIQLSRADGVGGSVAPHEGPPGPHTVIDDVSTPFDGELCDCHEETGDGILDLSMKFQSEEVVSELLLDDLSPGELVELTLTGTTLDGTEFQANDCIRLVPPGDVDGDGIVGVVDFLLLLAEWGVCGPAAECSADYNGDGMVGILDLLILLVNWTA